MEREEQFARIEKKIDELIAKLDRAIERQNTFDVWRATVEEKLVRGAETMNRLEKERILECARLQSEVDSCIEKRVVLAYLAGAGIAGAGLMKLFGG